MRGPLNVNAKLTPDGHTVMVEAGPRHGSVAMSVGLDIEQATLLYDLLGHALADSTSETEYQDWLARQAFPEQYQIDQGGEIIPMHTMEDDYA